MIFLIVIIRHEIEKELEKEIYLMYVVRHFEIEKYILSLLDICLYSRMYSSDIFLANDYEYYLFEKKNIYKLTILYFKKYRLVYICEEKITGS